MYIYIYIFIHTYIYIYVYIYIHIYIYVYIALRFCEGRLFSRDLFLNLGATRSRGVRDDRR